VTNDELIDKLLRFPTGTIVEVNVPQLRAGDEGPTGIISIEYDENHKTIIIEVD